MELRVRCDGFIMRAVKLHPPKLLSRPPHRPFLPFSPLTWTVCCHFIQPGLRAHSYLHIPSLLSALFFNGGQRLRAGLASCGGDREKVGQESVTISTGRGITLSVFETFTFGSRWPAGRWGEGVRLNKMADWCRLVTAVAWEAAVGNPLTETHPLMRAESQPLDPFPGALFHDEAGRGVGGFLFLESRRLLVSKRHNKR